MSAVSSEALAMGASRECQSCKCGAKERQSTLIILWFIIGITKIYGSTFPTCQLIASV